MKKKAIITIVLIAFLFGIISVNYLGNKTGQSISLDNEQSVLNDGVLINENSQVVENQEGGEDQSIDMFSTKSVDGVELAKKSDQSQSKYKIIDLTIKGLKFRTEVADTPELQKLGLGNREKIGEDEAMLFAFANSAIYSFWMKDMNFAIDMIWINEDKKIVHIEHNISTSTYPETFRSKEDAKYVLEVKAGIMRDKKIKVGDRADFKI